MRNQDEEIKNLNSKLLVTKGEISNQQIIIEQAKSDENREFIEMELNNSNSILPLNSTQDEREPKNADNGQKNETSCLDIGNNAKISEADKIAETEVIH